MEEVPGAWDYRLKHKNYTALGMSFQPASCPYPPVPPPHSLSGPAFTTDDNMASQLLVIVIMTTSLNQCWKAPVSTMVPARLGQHGQAGAEEQRNAEKVDRALLGASPGRGG